MNIYYFETGQKPSYNIEATVKHNNNDSIVSFSSYFITYITVHSALVCSKTIKALLKNESSSQTCTHSTLMNDPSLHRMATHSTLSTLFTSWKIVIIKFVFYAKTANNILNFKIIGIISKRIPSKLYILHILAINISHTT